MQLVASLFFFDNQRPFGLVLHSTCTWKLPQICMFLPWQNGGLNMEHSTSLFFFDNLHPCNLIFHSTIILCCFGGCFFALGNLFVFAVSSLANLKFHILLIQIPSFVIVRPTGGSSSSTSSENGMSGFPIQRSCCQYIFPL